MKLYITLVFFILFFSISVKAQDISVDYMNLTASISFDRNDSQTSSVIKSTPDLFLVFYKKIISPQDNASCPFHPSCSSFSSHAFNKEGFLGGYLLTFDRLLRCNGMPGMYDYYPLDNSRNHFLDPLDNYSSSK